MTDDLLIRVQAEIRDAVSKLDSIQSELAQTGEGAAQLGRKADTATGPLDRLTGVAMRVGAGLGAMELARRTWELGQLGETAQNTERGLAAYAGSAEEATASIAAMQRATNGSISEMEAMRTASKLLSLGIAENADELERYTHNVALVGAAQGLTTAEALDAANRAIANGSVEMLDNLGLSSARVKERISELQAAQSDLSREQAFGIAVQEELTRTGGELADAGVEVGNGYDRARTAMSDFATGAGDAINGALTPLMDAFGGLDQALKDNDTSWRELGETIIGMIPLVHLMSGDWIASASASWGEFTGRTEEGQAAIAATAEVLDILAVAATNVEDPILSNSAAMAANTGYTYDLIDAIDIVPGAMETMGAAFIQAAEDAGYTTEQAHAMWDALYESGPAAAAAASNMSVAGGAAINMGADMAAATRNVWALKDALDALNNERTGNYGTDRSAGARVRTKDERDAANTGRTGQRGRYGLTVLGPDPREAAEREKYLGRERGAIERAAAQRERARQQAAEAARLADIEAKRLAREATAAAKKAEREATAAAKKAEREGTAAAKRAAREAAAAAKRAEREGTAAAKRTSTANTKAARESEAAAKKLAKEQKKAAEEARKAHEDAAKKVMQSYDQAYKRVQSAAESAFGTIRSAVGNALNVSPSVGENDDLIDRLLPGTRANGPSEIMRRLQDVVNRGDESEWAQHYAELLGVGPGTGDLVKAKAAAMMQDIQDGFRLDLLDREAIKEQVRREIRGNALREELMDEVAKELAPELGPGMVARAMGRDSFDVAGAMLGDSFVDSVALSMTQAVDARKAQFVAMSEQMGHLIEVALKGSIHGVPIVDAIIKEIKAAIYAELRDELTTS